MAIQAINDDIEVSQFCDGPSDEEIQQARQDAAVFKALASKQRMIILSQLKARGGLIAVHELVELCAVEQPTVSHHLAILRDAGLVRYEDFGLCRYYQICEGVHSRIDEILQRRLSVKQETVEGE